MRSLVTVAFAPPIMSLPESGGDKLVVFDLPNDRIGFAAFDCSLGLNASGGSSDEGGTQEPSSSSKSVPYPVVTSMKWHA